MYVTKHFWLIYIFFLQKHRPVLSASAMLLKTDASGKINWTDSPENWSPSQEVIHQMLDSMFILLQLLCI